PHAAGFPRDRISERTNLPAGQIAGLKLPVSAQNICRGTVFFAVLFALPQWPIRSCELGVVETGAMIAPHGDRVGAHNARSRSGPPHAPTTPPHRFGAPVVCASGRSPSTARYAHVNCRASRGVDGTQVISRLQ